MRISSALCMLKYTLVDEVAKAAHQLGPSALLAKADIKAAYPVHQDDPYSWEWSGKVTVRRCNATVWPALSTKVFTAVADALEWCIQQQGVMGIDHYLDDVVILAVGASGICCTYLSQMQAECEALGVTLALGKTEDLTTCLVFLGIHRSGPCGRQIAAPQGEGVTSPAGTRPMAEEEDMPKERIGVAGGSTCGKGDCSW